jgi:phenylpyruvate tautomerase PptA (4-oxalocrotonate tautomerase family)
MPFIDVYAPADLFPDGADRALAEQLTAAAMRAEGAPDPAPRALLDITAAYIHRMPATAVHTAGADAARTVRVQVLIGAGGLDRAGQRALVAEATDIVARVAGDPTQAERTWVVITEAMEGGWGINGAAYGREDAASFLGATS